MVDCSFIAVGQSLHQSELDLRFRVLREPLGLPRGSERFAFEDECLHLAAVDQEQVVGCVLFHPSSAQEGRLLQMAVTPELQGQGLGRRLVAELEAELLRRHYTRVELHARDHAVSFYARLGYTPFGDPFTEVGIDHRMMQKSL